MVIVDSSVWIDFFNDAHSPQVNRLVGLLAGERVAVGDLIVTEVLRGFRHDRDFNTAMRLLARPAWIELGGRDIAVAAARNYRKLRAKGVTIRGTIDLIIATRCILDGHALLFSDRDFAPFVEHLGLLDAMALAG